MRAVNPGKLILFTFLALVFSTSTVYAHPGRTASDGCHYCRTNCSKWGVPWNQRHCHGGSLKPAPAPAPTPDPSPPKTYEFQGKTYYSLQEYEAAKDAYERALRETEEEARRLEEEKRKLEEERKQLEERKDLEEKQKEESDTTNGGEIAGESVNQETKSSSDQGETESADDVALAGLATVFGVMMVLLWAAVNQKGPFAPRS